jgi:hypothetical protein
MSIPDWEGLPTGFNPNAGLEFIRMHLTDYGSGRETRRMIAEAGVRLTCLLISKNERYGNSALAPMSVFARDISPEQRLAVRMDDKINRIVQGLGTSGGDAEDPRVDLAGYLLLDIVRSWSESLHAD